MNKPSDRLKPTVYSQSTDLTEFPETNLSLPHMEDQMRALSNPVARSALFTAGNRARARKHRKRFKVATVGGVVMTYTGETLYQDDHDVFMAVCKVAAMHSLGAVVRFVAHDMIKHLGWTINTASYERLKQVLDRLSATSLAVTFTSPKGVKVNYTGSLVRSFKWREDGDSYQLTKWEILLELEIVALFGRDSYSRLNWEIHKSLKNAGMAKWLHNFYNTHQYPYAYSVAKLAELMGSESKSLSKLRFDLKANLDRLVKLGFLAAFVINDDDRVQVVRKGFEDSKLMHFSSPGPEEEAVIELEEQDQALLQGELARLDLLA